MLTLNQIRFQLRQTINAYSDDIDLDYRLLDAYIQNKRVKWFVNTYNKFTSTIPSVYYQTISCLEVELVDSSECCDELTGCYVLRSVEQIPQIMSLSDGEVIARVSGLGIDNKSYNIISQFRIPYWGNSRYNQTAIGVTYINNYLYLFSKDPIYYPQIEKVTLRAVFRNPMEAGRFISCAGTPCWSEEDPYPLEERLWEWMKQDILASDLNLKLKVPRDNSNDNEQNTTDLTPDGGTKAG
jgi:hypothetical protein